MKVHLSGWQFGVTITYHGGWLLLAAGAYWRARVVHLTIDSRLVHAKVPLTLVMPAGGGAHRPLLVFLHGYDYDNNSQLTDQMFAALHALGPRAPILPSPAAASPSGSTAPAAHGPPTCLRR